MNGWKVYYNLLFFGGAIIAVIASSRIDNGPIGWAVTGLFLMVAGLYGKINDSSLL